jgi:hypothetical protein
MTSQDRLIRARLGLLALAAELKNVTKACKLADVSRSQFYALKKAYETHGRSGLAPRERRKPVMPNRTTASVEAHILSKTRSLPSISYVRLAQRLIADGIPATPAMVRYVWQREGISTRTSRHLWLKRQEVFLAGSSQLANGHPQGHGAELARPEKVRQGLTHRMANELVITPSNGCLDNSN